MVTEAEQSLLKEAESHRSVPGHSNLPQTAIYLPHEILLEIVSYIAQDPDSQASLASFCLVCRSWYHAAVEQLYHYPIITGRNYELFVRTLCPSINPHVRLSGIGSLVHRLDMKRLLHDGSKSLTARLLGRVKENLVVFDAPAATFSLNCFAALAKCQSLKILDLELVMIRVDLISLFKVISKLPKLQRLYLRGVTIADKQKTKDLSGSWPPSLDLLSIKGHICACGIHFLSLCLPETNCKLAFLGPPSHCMACPRGDYMIASTLGANLRRLELGLYPSFPFGNSEMLLLLFPNLIVLSMAYLNLKAATFTTISNRNPAHPLVWLILNDAGLRELHEWGKPILYDEWGMHDLVGAVKAGGLGNLRQVAFVSDEPTEFVDWISETPGGDYMEELVDLMQALEDQEVQKQGASYEAKETGVWSKLY